MQIQVTDGYITGYAQTGGFVDGIEVSEELISSLEPEKIGFYKFENGIAVFDKKNGTILTKSQKLILYSVNKILLNKL